MRRGETMPTQGIRIVNETNLTSFSACKDDSTFDGPMTLDNVLVMENMEPLYPAAPAKTFVNLDTKHWGGGYSTVVSPAPPPVFQEIQTNSMAAARRGGGRRSLVKEEELSPEEEARLRMRRERNKQAAARCRKRRVDQTETLQAQVDEHEEKKRLLQEEIHNLQTQKEELQFILDAHREVCRRSHVDISAVPAVAVTSRPVQATRSVAPAPQASLRSSHVPLNVPKVVVKSELPEQRYQVLQLTTEEALEAPRHAATPEEVPRPRPASLSLAIRPQSLRSIEGIPIETPTNVFGGLNFDALMDGRTGLTPTNVLTPVSISMSLQTPVMGGSTPTCSTQQQRFNLFDLSSPDKPKLVSL